MATPPSTTASGGMTAAMKAAYYRETFLDYFYDKSPSMQLGVRVPLPQHEGLTVDFPRYHELALVESAGTEGTYGDTTEKPIEMMNITATLAVWYNTLGFSTLLLKTTRDRDVKGSIMELLGRNAGTSMEWQIRKAVATSGMTAIRVDCAGKLDSTYEKFDVPVGRNNTNNTTTAIYLPALTQSSGRWRGSFLTIKRGKSEGYHGRVTAWNATTDIATVSPAMPETADIDRTAFASGNQTFVNICQPFKPKSASYPVVSQNKPIRSGDVLTVDALLKATSVLSENGAEPFENGNYKAFISLKSLIELKNDSDWKTMVTNTMRDGLITGNIGTIAGCDLVMTSLPATFDSPTTGGGGKAFQTTARGLQELEVTLVFGKNAFGVVDLDGDSDSIWDPEITFYDKQDTYNKHKLHGFATWLIHFVVKALNANYCVGIITYRG